MTAKVASLAFVAVSSLVRMTLAAPCGRPDIDLTLPPDGATDVPPNAALAAHYASPATYDAEPVSITGPDGNAIEATQAFDSAEGLLRVTPSARLSAGEHEVTWPALRGVGGPLGRGRTSTFTVGSALDTAPPSFEGLVAIDWDLYRERDECTDKLDDRFVFELKAGTASDDSAPELLSLLVFETRDPAGRGAAEPTPVALRSYPGNSGVIEVRRPADHAGRTCFAAVVQDLLGNVSGGGEREVCIKTKAPPFFDGCSFVAPLPRCHFPASAFAFALGLGLLRRGRNARRGLA